MASELAERLKGEVLPDEACLVGLFWQYPEFYDLYSDDQINGESFLNDIWKFFFDIGRVMSKKGANVFNDIATYQTVEECRRQNDYIAYGSYKYIKEAMDEAKFDKENFDMYYQKVIKYSVIKEVIQLGVKMVQAHQGSKYDYKNMTGEQVYLYWMDKFNDIIKDVNNSYEVYDLLDGLDEAIDEMDENTAMGMPFFNSPELTDICQGWANGAVYIMASFSGKGKTSFTINKVVLGCIKHNEKLLIIANEEGIKEFRRHLFVAALGNGTGEYVNRQRLLQGTFSDDEKQKLKNASKWIKDLCGDKGLIKLAVLNAYTIENVKKIVTHWANRGYTKLIIDTGKPSDSGSGDNRWATFADDFKDIHRFTRPDTGLNIATWVNVQLANSAVFQRYLDSYALADCKAIRNEASVVFIGRPIRHDEYKGGTNAIRVYTDKSVAAFVGTEGGMIETFELDRVKDGVEQHYFLLFTDKNRRGQSNDVGLHILVFRVDWSRNIWEEVGWTVIDKTYKKEAI